MNNERIVKNTTLDLTVAPEYVRGWGLWEAVREFVQNGLDAADRGWTLTIERSTGAKRTIRIRNEGIVLERKSLLLGVTSKDGDSGQRGKFGEGYKLALLALARTGIDVQIRTGKEMWTASIGRSDTFDSELLRVAIREQPKHVEEVEVQIHGVDDATWTGIVARLLNVPGLSETQAAPAEIVAVGNDKMLLSDRFRGKLFCRGLYVGMLPSAASMAYGYDLADIQLDRDRKMAETWSLNSAITDVLTRAVNEGKLAADKLFDLLNGRSAEAKHVASYTEYGTTSCQLSRTLAPVFKARHGENAVPVESMTEALALEHYGLTGVTISTGLAKLLAREMGDLSAVKARKAFDTTATLTLLDLDAQEVGNLRWATTLLAADLQGLPVKVVTFVGDEVLGLAASDGISIARRALATREMLVSTLVHEAAHLHGGPAATDGSALHRAEIERIFATLVVRLS